VIWARHAAATPGSCRDPPEGEKIGWRSTVSIRSFCLLSGRWLCAIEGPFWRSSSSDAPGLDPRSSGSSRALGQEAGIATTCGSSPSLPIVEGARSNLAARPGAQSVTFAAQPAKGDQRGWPPSLGSAVADTSERGDGLVVQRAFDADEACLKGLHGAGARSRREGTQNRSSELMSRSGCEQAGHRGPFHAGKLPKLPVRDSGRPRFHVAQTSRPRCIGLGSGDTDSPWWFFAGFCPGIDTLRALAAPHQLIGAPGHCRGGDRRSVDHRRLPPLPDQRASASARRCKR